MDPHTRPGFDSERRAGREAGAAPGADNGRRPGSDPRGGRTGDSMPERTLHRLLESMPKAELHLHLDGSLRIETALELARSREVDAPRDFAGMFEALVAPDRCTDQADLLRAFELPVALLQDTDALRRVARELVEDKARDNVRYVEIRWAPALHTGRGVRLGDGVEAVCSGAAEAAAATGTAVRLIATAMRSHDPTANLTVAETALRYRDRGLVGFDLAGPEAAWPDPLVHRRAFEAARAGGLRITLHAGEWGGAAQVRAALALDPERIAHGPGAIEDPELCAELVARGVTLDLCPTSNVQAAIVPSLENHPIARLHRRGVGVTLSTDDPTVSDLSLSEEYRRAIGSIGLTLGELWAIDRHALDVAFADDATLGPIRAAFVAWAGAIPELAAES